MKVIGLTILLLLSCSSQNKIEEIQLKENSEQKSYLTEKEVILTKSRRNLWLEEQYGYKTWEPNRVEIEQLKLLIRNAIQNNEFDFLKKPIQKSINSYYRQYIPYINENGEKIIQVNAFCEILKMPPDPNSESKEWTKLDWKNKMVLVDDGGICYWQMKANLKTNEYFEFYTNGPG